MRESISELSRRLADNAERVCRRYLSNGRREGRYWSVGDLANTPGRSLYVRLHGSSDERLAAGKWTDAATGEHGDLLDVIAAVERHGALAQTLEEARRFLGEIDVSPRCGGLQPTAPAAERLLAASRPIAGTLTQRYLGARGLSLPEDPSALFFHPRCYYRPHVGAEPEAWPAMIAAVTDDQGRVLGAHRTWLARNGLAKAPLETPRRAMGRILGGAVRFGTASERLIVGEGIETVLSVQAAFNLPAAAALSAAHLTAFAAPPILKRLYIARDNDAAGARASRTLADRAVDAGVEGIVLSPRLKDFNDDLLAFGAQSLAMHLRPQVSPQDADLLLGLCTDDRRLSPRHRPARDGSPEDRARG